MLPEMAQGFWTICISGLCIAHAPIINWLQLTEVSHQDNGDVTEGVFIGVEASLAEMCSLAFRGRLDAGFAITFGSNMQQELITDVF